MVANSILTRNETCFIYEEKVIFTTWMCLFNISSDPRNKIYILCFTVDYYYSKWIFLFFEHGWLVQNAAFRHPFVNKHVKVLFPQTPIEISDIWPYIIHYPIHKTFVYFYHQTLFVRYLYLQSVSWKK